MILRALKLIVIAIVLWFALPYFSFEMPDNRVVELYGRGGVELLVVLRIFSLYSQTVVLVLFLTRIWTFGERSGGGSTIYRLQQTCMRLLLYTVFPIICLGVLMTTPDLRWDGYTWSARTKFAVGAALCFMRTTDKKSVYGLQHARLHLDAYVPMWMNMGYWKVSNL